MNEEQTTKNALAEIKPVLGDVFSLPPLEMFDFRLLRKQKNLTLRDVENTIGVSNAYLSQLETGKISNRSYNIVRNLLQLYKNNSMEIIKTWISAKNGSLISLTLNGKFWIGLTTNEFGYSEITKNEAIEHVPELELQNIT